MENLKITLKAARVNANLTIRQSAKKIGVSASTLIKWEKNPESVAPEKQRRISDAYDMPIDNIIFLNE